jgi:hypothetical protein
MMGGLKLLEKGALRLPKQFRTDEPKRRMEDSLELEEPELLAITVHRHIYRPMRKKQFGRLVSLTRTTEVTVQ